MSLDDNTLLYISWHKTFCVLSWGYTFCSVMEGSESRHRAALSILSGIPWALGIVGWAGMGYLIRDWRWLNGVAGLLNFLVIPTIWWAVPSTCYSSLYIWWALALLVGFCMDSTSKRERHWKAMKMWWKSIHFTLGYSLLKCKDDYVDAA